MWLTEKKSDVFDMWLRYYDPQKPATKPSYTGNIAEWEWKHNGMGVYLLRNTYTFSYDKLNRNRLVDAEHYLATASFNTCVERGIEYDLNGNIKKLKRYSGGVILSTIWDILTMATFSHLSQSRSPVPRPDGMSTNAGPRLLALTAMTPTEI